MRLARGRDSGMAGRGIPDGRVVGSFSVTESAGGRPFTPSRTPAIPPSALARLVAGELHKAEAGFAPDPARLAQGWTYRFVAEAVRAEEMATLYRELGFEVALEPVGEAASPACRECRLVAVLRFRAIYTRRHHGDQASG